MTSLENIRVIAFDCDGVLFDTELANKAYYNQVLNHFGKPDMTHEQFVYTHMHTADEAIAYLFKDAASIRAAQAFRKEMGYLKFIKYMEIEPHLKTLLKNLRPKYKTAIATNRSDTLDSVLMEHGLVDYFDLVVSSLAVERPKPHPDALIKILKYFGIKPHNAIYVGDSEVDEQAARAAGVPLVAYKNPSLTADFHIENLGELEEILSKNFTTL